MGDFGVDEPSPAGGEQEMAPPGSGPPGVTLPAGPPTVTPAEGPPAEASLADLAGDATYLSKGGETEAPRAVPGFVVRWGIPSSVVGLVAFVAALALGVTLYVLGVFSNASEAQFATNVLGYGVMFGVVVVAVRLRGSGSLGADVGVRFRWIDLLLGLAGAFAAKIVAAFFAATAQRLAGDSPVQGNLQIDSDAFWIALNTLLFACLLGPFVEEVFFRGMLLRGIRNRVLRSAPGSVDAQGYPLDAHRLRVANTVAILVSSAVFMALHLYESSSWASALALGGATFFLGLINARLTVSTGRLGAGIVAHVLFNASSVLALLAIGG